MASASLSCAARVMLRSHVAVSSAPSRAAVASRCRMHHPSTSASSAAAAPTSVANISRSRAGTAATAQPITAADDLSLRTSRFRGLVGGINGVAGQRIAAGGIRRPSPSSSSKVARFATKTTATTPEGEGGAGADGGEDDVKDGVNVGGGSVDSIRIVKLQGADVGALSDVLLSIGATCCSVEDADLGTEAEQELYAGDEKVWRRCNVTAMFAPDSDIPGKGRLRTFPPCILRRLLLSTVYS